MNFRERPEYREWRESVFSIFGRVCIRCGYDGNIHAHHVRPVHLYPELAFDPQNGVPVCGNCHTAIKGTEMDFVEEFERLQQLNKTGPAVNPRATIESRTLGQRDRRALKLAAETDPGDMDAVISWFLELGRPDRITAEQAANDARNRGDPFRVSVSTFPTQPDDDRELIDFYNRYHLLFEDRVEIYLCLANALVRQECPTEDVLMALDGAERCAERDQTFNPCLDSIVPIRLEVLNEACRHDDACAYLRGLISRYPNNAELHRQLVDQLIEMQSAEISVIPSDECIEHALICSELVSNVEPATRLVTHLLAAKIEAFDKAARTVDACAFLRMMIGRHPKSAELHRFLSAELAEHERTIPGASPSDECIEHALIAAELGAGSAPIQSLAAAILTAADRYPEALCAAKRALEVAGSVPERAEAFRAIAFVHAGAHLHDEALCYLYRAFDVDETDPETLSHLRKSIALSARATTRFILRISV